MAGRRIRGRRSRAAGLILVALLAAAGCASAPRPALPPFTEAAAVAADKALIVVYRDARQYASALTMPVAFDGFVAARLPNGSALQCLAAPGTRTVTTTMSGAQAPVRGGTIVIEARPGERYFLKATAAMGMTTLDLNLGLVDPARALEELKSLRMIAGPGGEAVLVEPPRPKGPAAAQDPVTAQGPVAAQGGPSPGGSIARREEARGRIPDKIEALLRTGTAVRLIVVMPEKDVLYRGPAFDPPLETWRKKIAAEVVTEWTATTLEGFGEAPGFSVVNRENVRDILLEFELQGSTAFDGSATARVGRMVGATHMLLLGLSRDHVAGDRYREVRSAKLIDMERNTILALDELAYDLAVDAATRRATTLERRLNGRRYVQDPATRRWYFTE
ncbi:MAG: hypothetical protein JNG85_08845 [Spirochaetaceae bacterium]|nr:hypothetical protein [Spirochaetaceae bacterium]